MTYPTYKIGCMGHLFPFRAYRYAGSRVGRIADVVTQPYDKITAEMRDGYLKRHPHNIVRVIKNPDYREAGAYLRRWIDERILEQDHQPSLYPYEQVFEFEGQTYSRVGFIGLVSLKDSNLAVKGHERVLREPLEDRLRLIRETESNEGLIFTLYADPSLTVDRLISQSVSRCPPVAEVADEHGVVHRLWQIADPPLHERVGHALGDLPLYIADGHHRFQTSVLFCEECAVKGWKPAAPESFDKRLVALFNLHDPALKILPTHRAIRNLGEFDLPAFLEHLAQFFSVAPVDSGAELKQALSSDTERIGLLAPRDTAYSLKLKPESIANAAFMPGLASPAREVGVNVLHEGILKPLLGIGAEELASQKYVDYYRNSNEMADGVRAGRYQLGFMLNPTTLEQVRQVSEKGEKMPQKSTDFYPKLLTGLAIMKMEIEKGRD